MKQTVLLGLMLLNARAGACSPPLPSPEFQKAVNSLQVAIRADQSPCGQQSRVDCTVYNLPAQRVAELRFAINRLSDGDVVTATLPTREGKSWRMVDSVRYGRQTLVWDVGGYSLAVTRDIETAFERLDARLRKSQQQRPRWLWRNCALAGLIDGAYRISDCRWNEKNQFSLTVNSALDSSLPAGNYAWTSAGTCGYFLLGPISVQQ